MKLAIYTSALLLGLSLVTLLVLNVITRINPSLGTFGGDASLAWAGTAGFGPINALVLSTVVLTALGAVKLVRSWRIGR